MLEAVQTLVDSSQGGGNAAATVGNATESSGDGAGTLDLSGSRDFLTREAAEEALAAMLMENAALRKVGCRCIAPRCSLAAAGPHTGHWFRPLHARGPCALLVRPSSGRSGKLLGEAACNGTVFVGDGLDCCEQIKLSTKSFGTDAAEVAAKGIANIVATLEEADLSDVIAGLPRRQAAQPQASGLICLAVPEILPRGHVDRASML